MSESMLRGGPESSQPRSSCARYSGATLYPSRAPPSQTPQTAWAAQRERDQRLFTEEEMEAQLARMSLALHRHYQEREMEREMERERDIARFSARAPAPPTRTLSGRDWEDQSFLTQSSCVSSLSRPTPQTLGSFHSLSSLSQVSALSQPQPRQLTRAGPQFDSFYSNSEPVNLNSSSFSELDRFLTHSPFDNDLNGVAFLSEDQKFFPDTARRNRSPLESFSSQ